MNKYDKLARNTLIFAIGSFASKALVFLLMPLYTRVLSPSEFGVSDIVVSTSNLIMPFMMLSINEAVIRYGMDKNVRRNQVFTIGITTIALGFFILCLAIPIFLAVDILKNYTLLIYLYIIMGCLRAVCSQFVRSRGFVKLYAIDGILATITTIGFNLLFLIFFKMGVTGFVLSVIASNLVSVIFLFWAANLTRYIAFEGIDKKLRKEMLKYSIPLIPSTMFWWITNVSDRYLVTYFCGESVNGVYAMAYKIPMLITIVSGIFYQAWQVSAIEEHENKGKASKFYSNISEHYTSLLLCAASGLIMLCIPLTFVLVDKSFFESWQYIPFLVISEVFSTLVTFLGSFYMVMKKSSTVLIAIGVGGISNIVMNMFLIPQYGAMGAALATLISYLLSFLVRLLDIQKLIKIKVNLLKIAICFFILIIQTAFLMKQSEGWFFIQMGFVIVMLVINIRSVIIILKTILNKINPNKDNRSK